MYTAPMGGGTTIKISGADNTAANPAFAPPPPPPRRFTANPTTNMNEGASISFQGMNFNASGSQIVVGYNNLVDPINNQTFSAQASFSGIATATFGHPNADPNTACTAKLSATQDGKTDNVSITGVQQQVVVAQRGLARVQNNQPIPLQPPDLACKGEGFAATSSPLDVLTIPVTAGYPFTPAQAPALELTHLPRH